MKSFVKLLLVSFTALLLLAGCKSTPIYNIDSQLIGVSGKHNTKDIKKAIIRAGASLGWSMNAGKKGHILGTLYIRKHMAVVDIVYNNKSYSIKYKKSANLNYDGENIHSNYNGWIKNLDRNIQVQLSML